ncbi:alpha-L-fucosidase [Pedobacter steynii]|uniref:alpha-L-fucosidase n=1 Tax=Pedobacter steynii TaxID=430522 RepID=A0A1G9JPC2_9SPHI|nr:alpha-L-fucosidase [Pedobacter steynii]NQX38314.1 alpha-L-fucosidase [Pedobacter steynii]SDL39301.1 alpha-L-fucosidase [Pedobacter steynii]
MKKTIQSIICLVMFCNLAFAQSNHDKLQWWKEARFGLFLHWGLYSIGEWNGKPQKGNEHFMFAERIPLKTYAAIGESFNPVKFNAEEWVKYAKAAGMKYIVITAKHHDGFAMFNSPSDTFNIVKATPFHHDPMKDLALACKKYGLKMCFYYSLGRDWASPDATWAHEGSKSGNTWDFPDEKVKDYNKYIENKVKPQLRELLTQYGPIGVIWFDTPEGTTPAQSESLRKLILSLQPNCIVNSRVGNGFGDYAVSEQKILAGAELKPWESCITMSGKWGFSKFDKAWKSPELLVRNLVEIVCKGGNLLLNIGPNSLGEFPDQSIQNLSAIGHWMKLNGEAIYGTKPWSSLNEYALNATDNHKDVMGKSGNDFTSKKISPDLYFNQKGNHIYVFARSWTATEIVSETLGQIKNIKDITLPGSKEKVKWEMKADRLIISLPEQAIPEIPVYVFKISTR